MRAHARLFFLKEFLHVFVCLASNNFLANSTLKIIDHSSHRVLDTLLEGVSSHELQKAQGSANNEGESMLQAPL